MLSDPPPLPFSLRMLSRLSQQIEMISQKLTIAEHQVFVQALGITALKTGSRSLPHTHLYYEAHIIIQGNCRYYTDEEQRVRPGTIFLHGPKLPHAFYTPEEPCQFLTVEFSISPNLPPMTSALWSETLNVLWEIQLLFDEAAQRAPGWQDRATSQLSVIISRALILVSTPQESTAPDWQEETEIITIIDQYFRDNLHLLIGLDDVADYVGISRRTLTTLFRRLTGESVMDYLHQLRMAAALTLVVNTTQPLAEIAKSVGIPDPAYFSNCFRRFHHSSPQKTRKLLAKGEYVSTM